MVCDIPIMCMFSVKNCPTVLIWFVLFCKKTISSLFISVWGISLDLSLSWFFGRFESIEDWTEGPPRLCYSFFFLFLVFPSYYSYRINLSSYFIHLFLHIVFFSVIALNILITDIWSSLRIPKSVSRLSLVLMIAPSLLCFFLAFWHVLQFILEAEQVVSGNRNGSK